MALEHLCTCGVHSCAVCRWVVYGRLDDLVEAVIALSTWNRACGWAVAVQVGVLQVGVCG